VKRRPSAGLSRSKARGIRAQQRGLDLLTSDEARAVLHELLSVYPALVPAAEQIANAMLATVSFSAVADQVVEVIQGLDLDDLDRFTTLHVRAIELHRLDDAAIFDYAAAEDRIVISADTDFGTLIATRWDQNPSVIQF